MFRFIRFRAYVVLGALFFVALGISAAVFTEERSHVLTVAFLNVGQGDSIYIESPTGVQLVIDGGPDSSILRELPTVMGAFDRTVDALVETHPDADHVAGLVDVLERYEVDAFIEPGITKRTVTWQRLMKEVKDAGISHLIARRGMRLELGRGAELTVLYPDFDVSTLSASKSNEGGVVMRLTYGESNLLLMADVPKKVEERLISLGEDLDSDILKVGHHGSKGSTGSDFIGAVSPAAAIISVGKNSYGHPTQEALRVLSDHNVKTLRTDEEGTIVFVSDGGEFVRTR